MKYRWKQRLAMLLAAVMTVFAVPACLQRAQALDLSLKCTLTVAPCSEESDYGTDLADLTVDLYWVAGAQKVTGYDTFTFAAAEGFTSLSDRLSAISDETTSEDYEELAQAATALVLEDELEPAVTVTANETAGKDSGLKPGMYLILAHDARTNYTVIDEDTGAISTTYYAPDYIYTFAPQLVSLPDKAPDENGVSNTANSGAWRYDVPATLKPSQAIRFGSLKIIKDLLSYEDSGETTVVFDVTAVLKDEVVYSDVVSMNFDRPYQQSYVIEKKIPVGAKVTVTEVYSGNAYTLVTDNDQTAVIEAEDIVSVSFTNEYDKDQKKGHGINNNFKRDEDGVWHWDGADDVPND